MLDNAVNWVRQNAGIALALIIVLVVLAAYFWMCYQDAMDANAELAAMVPKEEEPQFATLSEAAAAAEAAALASTRQ